MTPAETLVLRVLVDEYLHPERSDLHPRRYGPYGRAEERTGLPASRIGEIEERLAGWVENLPYPDCIYEQIKLVCDTLHTPYPASVLERSL